MAYSLIKIGDRPNIPWKTYIIDSASELQHILEKEKPPVGSEAEVIGGSYEKYKINNSGQWIKISS